MESTEKYNKVLSEQNANHLHSLYHVIAAGFHYTDRVKTLCDRRYRSSRSGISRNRPGAGGGNALRDRVGGKYLVFYRSIGALRLSLDASA
jgi:hypothetical protein